MSVEAIAAMGAQLAATASAAAPAAAPVIAAPAPAEGVFNQLVNSLGEMDAGIDRSGRAATELALGQADNLHQVMIGAERTRLQFELAMSMRNRVLEAYQEIMRMQV